MKQDGKALQKDWQKVYGNCKSTGLSVKTNGRKAGI